ncbi:MAG TPA: DegT/DnrJ/EryC1/StrS family aminotransferase [Coriobacteriia bacterium]
MKVAFVDLKAQGGELLDEFDAAFRSVVGRAAYTLGPEVREFESAFAGMCGCSHAIGVSSGTDALKLAYLALGVHAGDEVVMPVNTFIATAEAATHIGARPVFVDCLAGTANIDPAMLAAACTDKTRAIVPVHLYGQPADMDPILEFAAARGIAVIEDACQAHGASYHGRSTGSMGAAAAFSFYPGKNLGALGDGGAVTTNDPALADEVALLRNHGQSDKYTHAEVGYCDRLHNLQAAFLSVKLPHLADANAARRAAAAHYDSLLAEIDGVEPIGRRDDVEHVYHLYVVQVDDRDSVRSALDAAGIDSGIHYPVPLHLTPAYRELGYAAGDFPVAERMAARILSLPMHPYLTPEQLEFVTETLGSALA